MTKFGRKMLRYAFKVAFQTRNYISPVCMEVTIERVGKGQGYWKTEEKIYRCGGRKMLWDEGEGTWDDRATMRCIG